MTETFSVREPDVPADHEQCWCQWGMSSGVCGMRWSPKDPGEPFPTFPLPSEPGVFTRHGRCS